MYNPPLIGFNSMHVVGLLSVLYCYRRLDRRLNDKDRFLITIFGVEFVYLFLVSFYNGTGLNNAVTPLYFLIDFIPFAIYLRIYFEDKGLNRDDVVDFVILVGLIQAGLALLSFAFQPVQLFFVDRLVAYGYTNYYLQLLSYRMFGFASSLTFETPVLQTLLSIIAIRKAMDGKWIYIVCAIVLFISGVINARVSIIVVSVGMFVLILFSKVSLFKKVLLISLVFLLIVTFVSVLLPYLEEWNYYTYHWLIKGVDEIDAIVFQGEKSYWTSVEKNQLPSGIMSKLFGTGHVTTGMRSLYGYSSDVGYINDAWLGGLFYLAFQGICYCKMYMNLFRSGNVHFSFCGVLFFLSMMVVNVKGSIFTMNGVAFLVVLLFLINDISTLKVKKITMEANV